MDSWRKIFDEQLLKDCLKKCEKVKDLKPKKENILRCFTFFPPEKTKIVILTEAPYSTVQEDGSPVADGLAFSSNGTLQPSLKRITNQLFRLKLMRELPESGNLIKWASQGVLLLNVNLTFSNEMSQDFWKDFTKDLLKKIMNFNQYIEFYLWGNCAQSIFKDLSTSDKFWNNNNKKIIYEYHHPSPATGKDWDFNKFSPNIDWDISFLRVYTDGATKGNGKTYAKAGWAVIIENYATKGFYGKMFDKELGFENGNLVTFEDKFIKPTNIRCELFAIIIALIKGLKYKTSMEIVTDSQYSIDVLTKWIKNWEKNNYIKSDKKIVSNVDLIKILAFLIKKVKFNLIFQNSHTNSTSREALGNAQADTFANKGSNIEENYKEID